MSSDSPNPSDRQSQSQTEPGGRIAEVRDHLADARQLLCTANRKGIRIPQDVRHWARAVGSEPVFALIMFSTGQRRAVDHESGGVA